MPAIQPYVTPASSLTVYDNPAAHLLPELNRTIKRSVIVISALTLGLGGLAATLPMTGAIIATGSVSVESSVKHISHPFGGVVADILVKDGDKVEANQILVRLDTTVSGANSELTGQSVDQLLALEARLTAERDGSGAIAFPASLLARRDDPSVASILTNEQRNFDARRAARSSQKAQMQQRIQQANADISAYRSQASSYSQQVDLINQELDMTRELYEKRYTTLERLNALERSAVGINSSRQTAAASIAQAQARIRETQAQSASIDTMARSDAAAQLVDVQAALGNSQQRKFAADDQFDHGTIRAPEAGTVDKLAIKTIGAVLQPGQNVLEIVPNSDALTVEARVDPADIDQIADGQNAVLMFSGLNRQTTPELEGRVTFVSASKTTEETGYAYYRVTVAISPEQLDNLGGIKMRVGMPVEVFIQTGQRTMLSYLTRPLTDQLRRAFRSN